MKRGKASPPKTRMPAQALPQPHPLVDRYLEHLLIQKGLAQNTLLAYGADLNDFTAFLEERLGKGAPSSPSGEDVPSSPLLSPQAMLEAVNEQILFLYIVHIRRKGLGGRSLARHLSALRGFFAFARE